MLLCFTISSPNVHTSESVNSRGIKQVRKGEEGDERCHSAQMLLQSESFPCFRVFTISCGWLREQTTDNVENSRQSGIQSHTASFLVFMSPCAWKHTFLKTQTPQKLMSRLQVCPWSNAHTQEILFILIKHNPMITKPLQSTVSLLKHFKLLVIWW